MHQIIVSPYSKKLRNGNMNPKNYPYWEDFVKLANSAGYSCVQIARNDEPVIEAVRNKTNKIFEYENLGELDNLIYSCKTFVTIDSFLPHLCHYKKVYGVVIFGRSDPKIFGYTENINILKDRKYLRNNQFDMWENTEYIEEAFVLPEVVLEAVNTIFNR